MRDFISENSGIIRIVHYIGSLNFGGSQSFVMGIYRNIDRSKVQFDFVTYPNEKEGFYKEIIDLGGRVYECPRYNGKNHLIFIKWWKCVSKGIERILFGGCKPP